MRIVLPLLACLLLTPLAMAQQENDAASELAFAEYDVTFSGAWADQPSVGAGKVLRLDWQEPIWLRSPEGGWVGAFPVAWTGPQLENGTWVDGSGLNYYGVDDGRWIARMVEDTGFGDKATSILGLYKTWETRAASRQAAEYLPAASQDCLLAPTNNRVLCGIPGFPGEPQRASLQTKQGTLTVQFADGLQEATVRYAPNTPYAARIDIEALTADGAAGMRMQLREYEQWNPVEGLPVDTELAPIATAHTQTITPPELGLSHAFPLTEALRLLDEEKASLFSDDRETTPEQDRMTYQELKAQTIQPFVYYADYRRIVDEPADHAWMIGVTDGHEYVFLEARRDGDPVDILTFITSATAQDNTTFRYIDAPAGALDFLPNIQAGRSGLPIVSDIMRWWHDYRGDAYQNVTPNAYGFRVGCAGCATLEWDIWAGYAQESTESSDNTTKAQAVTTSVASLLHVDLDGRVLAYEEYEVSNLAGEQFGPDSRMTSSGLARSMDRSAWEVTPLQTPDAQSEELDWLYGLATIPAFALVGAALRRRT